MATREVWANPTTKGDTMFETAEQERARAQREIKTLKRLPTSSSLGPGRLHGPWGVRRDHEGRHHLRRWSIP